MCIYTFFAFCRLSYRSVSTHQKLIFCTFVSGSLITSSLVSPRRYKSVLRMVHVYGGLLPAPPILACARSMRYRLVTRAVKYPVPDVIIECYV